MGFREVLPSVCTVVRAWIGLRPEYEVTVVRDLAGLVRVIVGRSPGTPAAALPDDAAKHALEEGLLLTLGRWAARTPVFIDAGDGQKGALAAVLRLARDSRVSADWERLSGDPAWFVVERHAAKRTWTGEVTPAPPWPIKAVDAGSKPAIVTFFSHKGGVGRTTALAAVAINLARNGWKVAVIDMDIEAPGLGQVFLKQEPDLGVLDFLIEGDDSPQTRARDITALVSQSDVVGNGENLYVVPAGRVDDAFIEMLARLDFQDTAPGEVLARRMRDLFTELHRESGLDLILVDARTGLHEVAGLMLSGLTHGAVVVGTASPQSRTGLRRVARLLSVPHEDPSAGPRPLVLVHGMAPGANDPRGTEEIETVSNDAYDDLCAEYYDSPPQQTEWTDAPVVVRWTQDLRGGGGQLTPALVNILTGETYRELARRIVEKFGRTLERAR